MQINTIGKIETRDILISNIKEVLSVQFTISLVESLGNASVTALHQFLNTDVLNDIDKLHGDTPLKGPVVRSIEGMTDLMSDHRVHDHRSSLPDGQGKDTSLYVELSGINTTMLHGKILLGKQASESIFDVVHGVLLTPDTIRPPTLIGGLTVTLFKVAQCFTPRP